MARLAGTPRPDPGALGTAVGTAVGTAAAAGVVTLVLGGRTADRFGRLPSC